ncbi:MAG TPA: substrate-binding domain-containing protein, partial [Abditibacteriaceae bacterium]
RADYTASEDDNTLVEGVSKDEGALGYFGYAFYEQNQNKLKVVGIDNGKGAVVPNAENIITGKYAPLSRPLFIYVNSKSAARPEVKAFVNFYLEKAKDMVGTVGYVPLPDPVYDAAKARFAALTPGTAYSETNHHATLEELYGAKAATTTTSTKAP